LKLNCRHNGVNRACELSNHRVTRSGEYSSLIVFDGGVHNRTAGFEVFERQVLVLA
jgi:hypothetical protein